MDIPKIVNLWTSEAEEAFQVAWHLYEKGDYSYSLFFGHLAIEKMLKALYVWEKKEQAPYIHNLSRLCELAGIKTSEEQNDKLIRITAYNLESRYPDEKRSFKKKCNESFTENELNMVKEVFHWVKSMIP